MIRFDNQPSAIVILFNSFFSILLLDNYTTFVSDALAAEAATVFVPQ